MHFFQILEWQHRLEDLRLRDLRSRRNAEHWSKEVEHLREFTRSQTLRIDQLEEEVVRLENQMEQRQLDWETREVELETLEDDAAARRGDSRIGGEIESSKVRLPDSGQPLSKQLEQALQSIKDLCRSVDNSKSKLSDSKKVVEEIQKKLRESDAAISAKDRIINDLRMQVPSSVDRAVAMATVTSSRFTLPLTEDYEAKQALNIAQGTVSSLRERLKQKEETLVRYEGMLKQVREEYEQDLKKRQDEMVNLQVSLRNQKQSYNELKSYNVVRGSSSQNTTGIIAQQANKINELQDDVQDLQASLRDLSTQLAAARTDSDKHLHAANIRQKDKEDLRESGEMERQMLKRQAKQEIDKVKTEINVIKQENLMMQEDIHNMKQAQEKAPSAILKSLVEKLRNDLSEKDKKQRAMSRAITELKQELMEKAEEGVVGESKADALAAQKQKINELNSRLERMQKQLKSYQEREVSSLSQVKALKEELSKKSSMLIKIREDKAATQAGTSGKVRFAPGVVETKEKEELRKTIKRLEDRLREVNQAERPLEDQHRISAPSAEEKALKNAEEMARWDEKKKWEHKVDVFKKKLDEADEEVSKLSKSNKGLRDIMSRMEREKMVLESRAKALSKAEKAQTMVQQLQKEKEQLKEQIEAIQHDKMMGEAQGVETMKLRNRFLQERIEAQERKITVLELSKKVGGGSHEILKELGKVQEKEKECQRHKAKLEEDRLQVKLQLEGCGVTIRQCIEVLSGLKNLEGQEDLSRAIDLLNNAVDGKFVKTHNEPAAKPKSKLSSFKEIKILLDEVKTLKDMNKDLIGKLEMKNRELQASIKSRGNAKKGSSAPTKDDEVEEEPTAAEIFHAPRSYTGEQGCY